MTAVTKVTMTTLEFFPDSKRCYDRAEDKRDSEWHRAIGILLEEEPSNSQWMNVQNFSEVLGMDIKHLSRRLLYP